MFWIYYRQDVIQKVIEKVTEKSMQNRRLLLGVIIKLMMFSGLALLIVVLFNSLFTKEAKTPIDTNNKIPLVSLDIAEMQLGQVRKIRWDNKEVAVLLRQFSEKLTQTSESFSAQGLHFSIDTKTRSKKPDYFVYYNMGDSKNCPLHYAAGVFKDVCNSNRFDEAGRQLDSNSQSYILQIPPHYFEGDQIVFGQWQP